MTSAQAQCPACGHNPLNHRYGQCLVIVTLPPNPHVPRHGEVTKAHCGCTYYSRQQVLEFSSDSD